MRKKKLETTDIDSYVIDNHKDDYEFPQIEAIKNNEQEKYVKQAIENLGETDCLLITLFYLNDNSIEEIQEITEMTQSNVKVRLFRARKRLYKELSLLLKEEIKTIL